jgi:hypothetical protein
LRRIFLMGWGAALALGAGPAPAASTVYHIPVTLSGAQLTQREVIFSPNGPVKYVWDSGNQLLSPARLNGGEVLTFNFNFDQRLLATDLAANLDPSEMIFWAAGGTGSLAAAPPLPYQWQFLAPSGDLLTPTISGTGVLRNIGTLQGVINPSQTFRTLDLTDSSFSFGGLQLTLTVPATPVGWTVSSVRVNFASDHLQIVAVPEPGSVALGCCGVALLGWAAFRKRVGRGQR